MEYIIYGAIGGLLLMVLPAMIGGGKVSLAKAKFANLGNIQGKTRADIIAAVGPPHTVTGLDDGKTLLQWQYITSGGGYHIALRFGPDDVCEGVTHEHSSK